MKSLHIENTLPDKENMKHIWELVHLDPYAPYNESDELFLEALKECTNWHVKQNKDYAAILDYHNFKVSDLRTIEDIVKMPFIHANYFKTHVMKSIEDSDVYLHVTSSGTSGQKSQHYLDQWTENVVFYIAGKSQIDVGFASDEECNYLVFNFEPFTGLKTGTARTNQKMLEYAPQHHINYALRHNGRHGHDFDSYGVIDRLLEYQKEGLPVRMLGFAAFLNFTMEKLKDLGHNELILHPDSRCLFGGGWKNHADKELPKQEFYKKINRFFGIPLENIRDKYGSVEHPISYVEDEYHNLHAPTYERVIVRDVKTLKPVPYGQPGFAHLISPVITSMPSHSILMGDLFIAHGPESCPSGRPTTYVEIVGRAGTSRNKSCAVSASEMLKRN